MCRMLVAAGEVNLSWLIDDFLTMAKDQNEKHENNLDKDFLHGDGWGIVYSQNGRTKIETSVKACYEDETIHDFKNIETSFCLLHARKSSRGSVVLENVHPFFHSGYAFCHNGTVDDELPFDDLFDLKGSTDSEKLFYYLMSNNGSELNEKIIFDKYNGVKEYTGITSIITNGETSFVVTWYSKKPEYYTLKILEKKEFIIISSEILPHFSNESWRSLNNHDIYRLSTSSISVQNIGNGR